MESSLHTLIICFAKHVERTSYAKEGGWVIEFHSFLCDTNLRHALSLAYSCHLTTYFLQDHHSPLLSPLLHASWPTSHISLSLRLWHARKIALRIILSMEIATKENELHVTHYMDTSSSGFLFSRKILMVSSRDNVQGLREGTCILDRNF